MQNEPPSFPSPQGPPHRRGDVLEIEALVDDEAVHAPRHGPQRVDALAHARLALAHVVVAKGAEEVDALGGRYWTAEDINIGPVDVEVLAQHCRFVFGRTHGGAASGDPSAFTAGGCLEGMRAALEAVCETPFVRHVSLNAADQSIF